MHNGPLTAAQRPWTALLSCAPGAALGGLTALEFDGFEGFLDEVPTVVLPGGADRPTYQAVHVHWSTRLGSSDVHPLRQPRRTRSQRSLLDAASWSRFERRARTVILAGVQQRVVSMLEKNLAPGGWLFIAHSESLNGIEHSMQNVAPAVFRKTRRLTRSRDIEPSLPRRGPVRLQRARSASQSVRTIRSISTAPPSASAVTPTVVRAGSLPGAKCRAYSAFTAA